MTRRHGCTRHTLPGSQQQQGCEKLIQNDNRTGEWRSQHVHQVAWGQTSLRVQVCGGENRGKSSGHRQVFFTSSILCLATSTVCLILNACLIPSCFMYVYRFNIMLLAFCWQSDLMSATPS